MKIVAMAGLIVTLISSAVLAQSSTPTPPGAPEATPTISNNTGAPEPVPTGKRMTCRNSAQALQGQDKRDQMQLCMEQARLDCLKEAIAKKVIGPQRRDFIKACMTE